VKLKLTITAGLMVSGHASEHSKQVNHRRISSAIQASGSMRMSLERCKEALASKSTTSSTSILTFGDGIWETDIASDLTRRSNID